MAKTESKTIPKRRPQRVYARDDRYAELIEQADAHRLKLTNQIWAKMTQALRARGALVDVRTMANGVRRPTGINDAVPDISVHPYRTQRSIGNDLLDNGTYDDDFRLRYVAFNKHGERYTFSVRPTGPEVYATAAARVIERINRERRNARESELSGQVRSRAFDAKEDLQQRVTATYKHLSGPVRLSHDQYGTLVLKLDTLPLAWLEGVLNEAEALALSATESKRRYKVYYGDVVLQVIDLYGTETAAVLEQLKLQGIIKVDAKAKDVTMKFTKARQAATITHKDETFTLAEFT